MAYGENQQDDFVPWEPPQEEALAVPTARQQDDFVPWEPPAAEEDTSIPATAQYTAGVPPWNPPRAQKDDFVPWEPPQQQQQQTQPQAQQQQRPDDFVPWQPPQERPEAEGVIGTTAREAAGATPATLGGLAVGAGAAGAGRIAGAALGRVIGGALGTWGGPLGAVGGWLGGGLAGGYIGEEIAKGIKSFLGFNDDAQKAANREANPMAAAAGQVAPLALGLSPGRGVQAGARLLSGGVGGAIEGATQVVEGDYSKERMAANIIGGILLPGNKQWLTNIEERAAARAGGGARPVAPPTPSEPRPRPGELDLTEGRPGTSGGPQGQLDIGGVEPSQPRPSRDTSTGQGQLPLEQQPEVGPHGQYEMPIEPRTQRDMFPEEGLGRAPERPGAAPAKPSTADGQYELPVDQPHGSPGPRADAPIAEEQAPPPATKAGGAEDWGKKTPPAEGTDTGVNIVADVEPTLAHAIEAKAPAQQAGILKDLEPRVDAILKGPSAEAAGKFREIGDAYRKMGQAGQAAKYDSVAKELDRQHALHRAAPDPAIDARMRDQGVTPRRPGEPLQTATPEEINARMQTAGVEPRAAAAARPAEVLRGPEPAAPVKAPYGSPERPPEVTGVRLNKAERERANAAKAERLAPAAAKQAEKVAAARPASMAERIRKAQETRPVEELTLPFAQELVRRPSVLKIEAAKRGITPEQLKTTARAVVEAETTPYVPSQQQQQGQPPRRPSKDSPFYREPTARERVANITQNLEPTYNHLVETKGQAVADRWRAAKEQQAAELQRSAPPERTGNVTPLKRQQQQQQQQQQQPQPIKPPPGGQPPKSPPPSAAGAAPPPGGGPPGSVDAAHAAISARIAQPPSLLSKIPTDWEGVKKTGHDLYTAAKDALHPLKQLAGEGLSPEQDFYKLARLIQGLPGRVLQQLEHGTYDIKTGKQNGDSLTKILKSVENDDRFVTYAIAKRAVELEARGVKTGIPLSEANTVIAAGAGKYEPVFRELVDYQGRVLTNLRKSGVISADVEAKMRAANQSYVPYYRLLDPNSELGKHLGVKPGVQATDPLHKIKGSERQILDPIDSIVKNTYLLTDAAHKNLAMQALEDWVLKNPQGNKIMRLRADEPRAVRAEVLQFMKDHGVNHEMANALENFQWTAVKPGDNTVKVFRDGKARTYEVLDPAIARSVKSMDRESFDLLTTILKQPASLLRAGATLSPEFIARNPIRDQFTAFIQSKHGYIPVYDMVRGMGHLWNKSEQFQSWLTHGGANATLVGLDRKAISMNPKDYVSQVKNVIKSPFEALRVASEFMENSTRMGEFLRATGKGVSPTEAAFASREVALDFARVGSKARALNAIIPFFNAQLEGVDRAARAFRDNPTGTLTKVGMAITAPSVALWFANKDDARYKELPQWQKDLFWIIPTDNWVNMSAADAGKIGAAHKRQVNGQWQRNDGTIYRIPKPFELGILFGSIPERALDAYYNQNPNAFKNLGKTVMEGLLPNIVPQALLPVAEQFANRSAFLDRALVPKQLEGLPPKLQFTPYTSETAKVIGNIISAFNPKTSFASPIIIDNYIRQYTGGVGAHVVDLMDKSLEATGAVAGKTPPTSTAADIPLLKAFAVRFPGAGAQSVQDFYDTYGERKTAIAENKFNQKHGAAIDTSLQNPGEVIHQQIGALHKKIKEAYESPKLSPDQKREFIDTTYLQIIETARRGNAIYERTKRQRP